MPSIEELKKFIKTHEAKVDRRSTSASKRGP